MPSPLQKEFDYYIAHQQELAQKYLGRVVVIKDQKVIGDYSDEPEAVATTQKNGHQLGTFLVQKVETGQSDQIQTFHSRVAFG